MKAIEKPATVLLLLSLTGCGPIINRIAPDSVQDAKGYYEELRQRQTDQILQSFDPLADKDELRPELGKVSAVVPEVKPVSVETLGGSAECKASGVCTKQIILEYKYPDRWILFRVTVSNRSGHYAITNLNVEPESAPLSSMSRFSLSGKGFDHYLILFLCLLSGGLTIYSFNLCIRTRIEKRKWLWLIITILGLGKLGIEWANGELWYRVLYITILPVGWGVDSVSPFVYTSIPAGAILFLLKRNQLMKSSTPELPASGAIPAVVQDLTETSSKE